VTGDAQGISEQDRQRVIDQVAVALDDMTMPLGRGGWESCVADLIKGAPILLAALADRDRELAELRRDALAWVDRAATLDAALDAQTRELAELRAKIAEVEWLCREHAYDPGGGVGHLVSRGEIRRILAASSGSAPTGQEER
jgi:hypothetical protein